MLEVFLPKFIEKYRKDDISLVLGWVIDHETVIVVDVLNSVGKQLEFAKRSTYSFHAKAGRGEVMAEIED